ncbi:winged helix DNA-binding protein [Croceicoccus sediminis]|uniref:winged helix DNA-binding protein n=1 Tax=Croceicoccus sediminis TaxID=2571150 RepID=UPI001182403B|nr:winged helix DNA-binding protein [Croceicoccus sediminis]
MPTYEGVIAEARRTNKMRLRRERIVTTPSSRDPQWDMLVDLFLHMVDSKPVSVTSLCLASNVPTTTSLRHINLLIEAGLITRTQSQFDRRMAFCELTNEGFESIFEFFEEAVRLREKEEHTDCNRTAPLDQLPVQKLCCPAHKEMLTLLQSATVQVHADSASSSPELRMQ